MPSLKLSYRRAEINAFWTLVVTTLFAVTWPLAAAFALPCAWAWGVGAAAGALLPGLVWTLWLETGIRAWNGLMRPPSHAVVRSDLSTSRKVELGL